MRADTLHHADLRYKWAFLFSCTHRAAGQHSVMISSAGTLGFAQSGCAAIHHLSNTSPPSGFADPNGLIKDKNFVYMYLILPF